jgi:hypothetical protein
LTPIDFQVCRFADFPVGGASGRRKTLEEFDALENSRGSQVENLRYGRQECLRYFHSGGEAPRHGQLIVNVAKSMWAV